MARVPTRVPAGGGAGISRASYQSAYAKGMSIVPKAVKPVAQAELFHRFTHGELTGADPYPRSQGNYAKKSPLSLKLPSLKKP